MFPKRRNETAPKVQSLQSSALLQVECGSDGVASVMGVHDRLPYSLAYLVYPQVELTDRFSGNHGLVALVFSMALGGRFLLGPVSGIISDLVTHHVAIMTGGALICVGMVSASFAQDLVSILFLLRIVCGTGSGLCFTAIVTVVSNYFHKYRTVAFGITMGAPGIGIMAIPYFLRWLIEDYGWRFAMACFACILAQICVLASLFYPHNPRLTPTCCSPCKKPGRTDEPEMETLPSRKKDSQSSLKDSCVEDSELMDWPREASQDEPETLISSKSVAKNVEKPKPETLGQRLKDLLHQKFLWVMCLNQLLETAGYATSLNFFPSYAQSLGFALLEVLLPFCGHSFQSLAIEKLLNGITHGLTLLLVSPILVRYVGPQNLPVAFGIVMLCSGVGTVVSPAVSGALYDVYGSYDVCYYLAGCTSGVAALSMFLIPFIKDFGPVTN